MSPYLDPFKSLFIYQKEDVKQNIVSKQNLFPAVTILTAICPFSPYRLWNMADFWIFYPFRKKPNVTSIHYANVGYNLRHPAAAGRKNYSFTTYTGQAQATPFFHP